MECEEGLQVGFFLTEVRGGAQLSKAMKQDQNLICKYYKEAIFMTKKRVKGVLKTWKEDRGFGFIKPYDGGKDIFMHISAVKGANRRPITGDVIHYQIAKDSRGKFKAINAQIEGLTFSEMDAGSILTNSNAKKVIFILGVISIIIIGIAVIFFKR
jgi:cold shock protein